MSDETRINLFEMGIQLPTHGHWVDILGHDELGMVWVRVRPRGYYDPNHWSCWS